MAKFTLLVNGQSRSVEAAPDTPLLWVLRDHLDLVGTKFGCGMGLCRACMVHIGGQAVQSCLTPVSSVGLRPVTTIEGLSSDGSHPLQKAWQEIDVAQCGYCQPGQLMTAAALLKRKPSPSDEEIDLAMEGNICRCGTYLRIRAGIHRAAEMMAASKPTELPQ